jgi:hypothetical protein
VYAFLGGSLDGGGRSSRNECICMLVALSLAVICVNCLSRTAYQETCQWCCKPLALQPRAPTREEAARHCAADRTVKKAYTPARTFSEEQDEILVEIELVQARWGLSDKRISKLVHYNNIVAELRSGRQLRLATRKKVLAALEQYR